MTGQQPTSISLLPPSTRLGRIVMCYLHTFSPLTATRIAAEIDGASAAMVESELRDLVRLGYVRAGAFGSWMTTGQYNPDAQIEGAT